jgi:2-amino-4-hydroxy-6-hydroxymethyldihydropteridine diphosphokinase
LKSWADQMQVTDAERDRWVRAGWLHDALRDAPLGGPTAHGPAAADRAAADGERDRGVLDAVRYHTIGSAEWDDVGRMLYLADFLEPGRAADPTDRSDLARRVHTERDAILQEVARRRIEWMLRSGWQVPPETVGFWNQLVGRADGRTGGRP